MFLLWSFFLLLGVVFREQPKPHANLLFLFINISFSCSRRPSENKNNFSSRKCPLKRFFSEPPVTLLVHYRLLFLCVKISCVEIVRSCYTILQHTLTITFSFIVNFVLRNLNRSLNAACYHQHRFKIMHALFARLD